MRAAGGPQTPEEKAEVYFRTTPMFETGDERYLWLNDIVAVGLGASVGGAVALRCVRTPLGPVSFRRRSSPSESLGQDQADRSGVRRIIVRIKSQIAVANGGRTPIEDICRNKLDFGIGQCRRLVRRPKSNPKNSEAVVIEPTLAGVTPGRLSVKPST